MLDYLRLNQPSDSFKNKLHPAPPCTFSQLAAQGAAGGPCVARKAGQEIMSWISSTKILEENKKNVSIYNYTYVL